MDIEILLIQSLQLLGLGMGAVFIILTALIGLITLVAKLVPEETRPTSNTSESGAPAAETPAAGLPADHVAAITAALHLHRRKR